MGSYTPQVCEVASKRYQKPQSKENNAEYIHHGKQGNGSCLGSLFDVTLPGSLVLQSIRTIIEATIERKRGTYVMML
jgi:hypothetical protein